jgi:hypothetical protein
MRFLALWTSTAFAAAAATAAFAQQPPAPAESTGAETSVMQACGADVQTYCNGVTPGQGRIAHCLRPHLKQLSPECKGKVVEAHAKRKQMQEQQPQP